MKKIKHITEIYSEKNRLYDKLKLLDDKINADWKGLKEAINPVNRIAGIFRNVFSAKQSEASGPAAKEKFKFSRLISLGTGSIARLGLKILTKLLV